MDERAQRVRNAIRSAEERALSRHPLLRHQNGVGATWFLLALAGMFALGALYATGRIPWYACLLGNAFFASILHEIEHDLIHFLYFRGKPLVHNAMMLLVWVFRGNVVHGWYRRKIHFHHHRASGSNTDVEERILGLGTPWGIRRAAVTLDGALAFLLNARRLSREIPGFRRRDLALASIPVYPVFALVALGFVLRFPHPAIDVLAVGWVLPNTLRQASLTLISSNVHYYGDVSSLDEETQVLRPFYLWPLQLFCFNFGSTHALHHYVVEQPFYIRQLIAHDVFPVLRANGVRFDDTATFSRANHFRAA
ncbi:MAG TPA: fatty acid desaturase [Vicinamibacteria bacterium]|nr:fatty acid desaturase [Vicinamibacteria bacterium]